MNTSKGRKTHQTRKEHCPMRKASFELLHTYANTDPNFPAELREEINAKWESDAAKAAANSKAYADAREVVLGVMSTEPMTVEQIYNACAADLPEDFKKGKAQYALLHYWEADVVKTENGKNPNTYALKNAD